MVFFNLLTRLGSTGIYSLFISDLRRSFIIRFILNVLSLLLLEKVGHKYNNEVNNCGNKCANTNNVTSLSVALSIVELASNDGSKQRA